MYPLCTGRQYLILKKSHRAFQASKYGPCSGAPGRIRTCDARLRSPALYPLSYEGVPQEHVQLRMRRSRIFADATGGVGSYFDRPARRLPNLLVP